MKARESKVRKSKEFYESLAKCQGTNKAGNPCRAIAVNGFDFCRAHGGRTKKHHIKNMLGKRSLVLPKSIAESYEESLADPRLVELREDIALWEARIQLLCRKLKVRESTSQALTVLQKLSKFKRLVGSGEMDYPRLVERVEANLKSQYDEGKAWEELHKATEIKRRLVASESKRLKDLNAVLTMEQTLALLATIAREVKKYLTPEDLLEFQKNIAVALNLTGSNFGQRVEVKRLGESAIQEMIDSDDDSDKPYDIVAKAVSSRADLGKKKKKSKAI